MEGGRVAYPITPTISAIKVSIIDRFSAILTLVNDTINRHGWDDTSVPGDRNARLEQLKELKEAYSNLYIVIQEFEKNFEKSVDVIKHNTQKVMETILAVEMAIKSMRRVISEQETWVRNMDKIRDLDKLYHRVNYQRRSQNQVIFVYNRERRKPQLDQAVEDTRVAYVGITHELRDETTEGALILKRGYDELRAANRKFSEDNGLDIAKTKDITMELMVALNYVGRGIGTVLDSVEKSPSFPELYGHLYLTLQGMYRKADRAMMDQNAAVRSMELDETLFRFNSRDPEPEDPARLSEGLSI